MFATRCLTKYSVRRGEYGRNTLMFNLIRHYGTSCYHHFRRTTVVNLIIFPSKEAFCQAEGDAALYFSPHDFGSQLLPAPCFGAFHRLGGGSLVQSYEKKSSNELKLAIPKCQN